MPDVAEDKIELLVGGRVHSGWTDASVTIGLDSLAASFDLSVTEQWPDGGGGLERAIIEAGREAVIRIGGEKLITGYIDTVEPDISDRSHSIRIAGRSKAADLIDCSAMNKPGSWSGRKLEEIASEISAPFGISVRADTDTGAPFGKFALEPEEKVFEAIERMTKMRGLLATSDADGNVVLLRPVFGQSSVRIEQGKHFREARARHDVSQRFSEYLVKGQSKGDDQHNGRPVAHATGRAVDPAITRNRPLSIAAEDQANASACEERAKWEAKVRAAQSQDASVTLPGWRDPNGKLWKAGGTVDLVAPALFVNARLLIASVNYQVGQGTSAALTLVYPDAYTKEPGAEADAAKLKKAA